MDGFKKGLSFARARERGGPAGHAWGERGEADAGLEAKRGVREGRPTLVTFAARARARSASKRRDASILNTAATEKPFQYVAYTRKSARARDAIGGCPISRAGTEPGVTDREPGNDTLQILSFGEKEHALRRFSSQAGALRARVTRTGTPLACGSSIAS